MNHALFTILCTKSENKFIDFTDDNRLFFLAIHFFYIQIYNINVYTVFYLALQHIQTVKDPVTMNSSTAEVKCCMYNIIISKQTVIFVIVIFEYKEDGRCFYFVTYIGLLQTTRNGN